ncbi:uracil nucleotide/cysteinyl leukotriene receptor isoform X2 [Brienomyrus brachyistius]|uniref:uracil nucleotide/cysteinyl leukotriene receptor isoform X2 n=1 Tax=Brienomyrus brachyistius TaxID=42636 RepID=UPI0020B232D6|nr:uracil nucleotide/cysteinyl leukotriene receptor isoform X2 [Brienomyrus brachyistius]
MRDRQSIPIMLRNGSDVAMTSWQVKETHLENVLFASFYIVIFIIAVPGNALALGVFSRQKKISPSKVFLMNLAAADLFYVMVLPMRATYHLMDNDWPFGETLCLLIGYLFYLNMYCSLFFMACISLDRFLAVVLPVRSLGLRQKPLYTRVVSVVLWISLIVCSVPMLLSKKVLKVDNLTRTVCGQLYLEKTSAKALLPTAVAFLLPSIIILGSYILILHRLWSLRQPGKKSVERKAVKMITLILLNFSVTFIPYHINRFIYIQASGREDVDMAAIVFSNRITSSLTCLSGVLDPVLYFFLTKTYQRSLVQFFCRRHKRQKKQNVNSASS